MPVCVSEEICGHCVHRLVCRNIDIFANSAEKITKFEKELPENFKIRLSCRDFINSSHVSSLCRDL